MVEPKHQWLAALQKETAGMVFSDERMKDSLVMWSLSENPRQEVVFDDVLFLMSVFGYAKSVESVRVDVGNVSVKMRFKTQSGKQAMCVADVHGTMLLFDSWDEGRPSKALCNVVFVDRERLVRAEGKEWLVKEVLSW